MLLLSSLFKRNACDTFFLGERRLLVLLIFQDLLAIKWLFNLAFHNFAKFLEKLLHKIYVCLQFVMFICYVIYKFQLLSNT